MRLFIVVQIESYEFCINNSAIDSILTLSSQDFSYCSTEIYSGAVDRGITEFIFQSLLFSSISMKF